MSGFGGGFGFGMGVPSADFLATALIFLSIFSSSVMTQELFIPASAHFLSLQAWHVFLDSFVISQFRFLAHSYLFAPVTARLKKARPENEQIYVRQSSTVVEPKLHDAEGSGSIPAKELKFT